MENENKKKLYPLKFGSGVYEKEWGREVWHIADMCSEDSVVVGGWLDGNAISDVMETYLERLVGDNVFKYFGRQFPLLVKEVSLHGDSPVMLHPDDLTAYERYDALGKAELWYVTSAAEDAKLYIGLKENLTAAEYFGKCSAGTIKESMNEIPAKAGQCFLIAPGTLHAASGKLGLTAVMESSDVDYIVSGASAMDSETQFTHLSESIDLVDLKRSEPVDLAASDEMFVTLAERPEFVITKIRLTDPLKVSVSDFESFIEYVCVKGAASVQCTENGRTVKYSLAGSEVILIPAETDDFIIAPESEDTVVLELTVRIRETADDYINPNTEPFLEGEDYEGVENMTDDEKDGEPEGASPLGFFK
ncbi:MAG: class I mannose-6-phosphate isomerase [Candidatus Cryptobacteroides sp.]